MKVILQMHMIITNSPGEFEVIQDVDSPEMDMSFTAPPYSPIVPHDDQGVFLDNVDLDVINDEDVNGSDHNTEVSQSSSEWKGFKIMGDNLDKTLGPHCSGFITRPIPCTTSITMLYWISWTCQHVLR